MINLQPTSPDSLGKPLNDSTKKSAMEVYDNLDNLGGNHRDEREVGSPNTQRLLEGGHREGLNYWSPRDENEKVDLNLYLRRKMTSLIAK